MRRGAKRKKVKMTPDEVPAILEELKPYFTTVVEAQLKDYGESANAGCWVSFRLPQPEDLEPFRGQDRSGKNARSGKRYTLMLIELTDQDEHHHQPRKLSSIAGAMCENVEFRQWAAQETGDPMLEPKDAANFIRATCGIQSRAELDSNAEAAKAFRGILRDYDAFRAG